MKTILVTGANGLVGGEAMSFFLEKGWQTIGIDNNTREKLFSVQQGWNVGVSDIDIRDERLINNFFKDHKFDAIIHTAAQPSHDYSKDHALEDFDINARGTLILLEATRKHCPEAVFVHISTDKVYGENMERLLEDGFDPEHRPDFLLEEKQTRYHCDLPFNEDLSLDNTCRSLFGCSKTAADIYVQEYGNYFGMKTVCFRCGCITGKNHKGSELHGFMAYLVKCIKEEISYNIFGYKGKQVRDQIHAYDLITACHEFIQNPKCGAVYNMGGGEERSVSILEAIKLVEDEIGKKAIVNYLPEPRKGDRIWDIHDISKFQKDFPNWNYKYSLQDIIKDLCQT